MNPWDWLPLLGLFAVGSVGAMVVAWFCFGVVRKQGEFRFSLSLVAISFLGIGCTLAGGAVFLADYVASYSSRGAFLGSGFEWLLDTLRIEKWVYLFPVAVLFLACTVDRAVKRGDVGVVGNDEM